MSKIFKRPKSYTNEGDVHARNVKAARLIKTQEDLDIILASQPDPKIAEGWLHAYGQFLPFVPKPFEVIQVGQEVVD